MRLTPLSTCSATRALPLRPSITDALLLAEVASRGSFDFGTGPFIFLSFSNEMIFVASRPEGSAHFDPRAPWLRILARHRRPHGVRLALLEALLRIRWTILQWRCFEFAGRFEIHGEKV